VESSHFAAAEVNDLRSAGQKGACGFDVAAFRGFVKLRGSHAIDGGFQLGPARESVGSREHELSIVQCKRFGRSFTVIEAHLGHGFRRCGAIGL
jgi:hypothetical protein